MGDAFEAEDDAAAVEAARSLSNGEAMELWQCGRLVGRFSKLGVFTPGAAE